MGSNDTVPEIFALILNGFTTLPACILAIWYRRSAALWLMGLCPVTAFGLAYQVLTLRRFGSNQVSDAIFSILIAALPGLLGLLLWRVEGTRPTT